MYKRVCLTSNPNYEIANRFMIKIKDLCFINKTS